MHSFSGPLTSCATLTPDFSATMLPSIESIAHQHKDRGLTMDGTAPTLNIWPSADSSQVNPDQFQFSSHQAFLNGNSSRAEAKPSQRSETENKDVPDLENITSLTQSQGDDAKGMSNLGIYPSLEPSHDFSELYCNAYRKVAQHGSLNSQADHEAFGWDCPFQCRVLLE